MKTLYTHSVTIAVPAPLTPDANNIYSVGDLYDEYEFKSKRVFSSQSYQPFVYVIRVLDIDKYYVGSRTRKGCTPAELGTKYFTSSKKVAPLWEGNPGNIEIVEVFQCASNHDALILEDLIIKEQALKSSAFLNIGRGGHQWNFSGVTYQHSEDTKKKISESNKGKPQSQEKRDKLRLSRIGKVPYNKGKTGVQQHSEEAREKMSLARKGVAPSEFCRLRGIEFHTGKKKTDEHNRKNSEAQKRRPKLQCEHCLDWLDVGNYKRWHGDNCRLEKSGDAK